MHAELQALGISCGRKRVARLMREQGLAARRPRHRTITTRSDPGAQVAPNLQTHLQHLGLAAAINLVRLVAWLDGDPLAPTRVSAFERLYQAA